MVRVIIPFLCFRPLTALFWAKYAVFCVAVAISSAVDGGFAVFWAVLQLLRVPCVPPSVVRFVCGFSCFSFLLLLYMYSWQILGAFGVSFGLFVAIIYCFSILTRACVCVLAGGVVFC